MLKTEGVCKYFGGLKAVDDVSMTVRAGEIASIIGPNGAGKTTFFNVCSGFYKPTKGKIYLNGEDITGLQAEAVSRLGMARTFQTTQLFKFMTVLENVKIGCHKGTKSRMIDSILHTGTYRRDEEYAAEKSLETLRRAGLGEYADVMAGNLPYGIQRRVEIARSLVMDPVILLLDEPAAGMNPLETEALSVFLRELNGRGQTILLIEHDMKFVMGCCHNIFVLNFGKRICEGPPELVSNNAEVQKAYFGSGTFGVEVASSAEN